VDLDFASLDLNFWTVLGWLAVGLIVGALARFLLPGEDPVPLGCLGTAVLGVLGSFVGGALGNLIQSGDLSLRLHPAGFLGSLLGSIVILLVLRIFR
jgi:uncharacterized membrane protein YeaQ/YmgE (transglycosylase-associated protein family)